MRHPGGRHGRRRVKVRDLPVAGRPVALVWAKRIGRCPDPDCGITTWAETSGAIRPRSSLTERARAEMCRRVGQDETKFLSATPTHRTRYVTGFVDLDRARLLDVVAGRSAKAVADWLGPPARGLARGHRVVALDLFRSYANGLVAHLAHATVVVDGQFEIGGRYCGGCRTGGRVGPPTRLTVRECPSVGDHVIP